MRNDGHACRAWGLAGLVVVLGSGVACGDGEGAETDCHNPPGSEVYVDVTDDPCRELSSHRFFTGLAADGTPELNEGMVPYEMTTPLFSDYTLKYRSIYMPPEEAPVPWRSTVEDAIDRAFDFPVGTVITKTFAVPEDMRDPSLGVHLVETRLLVHEPDGWAGRTYIWEDDQTEAIRVPVGRANVHLEWIHTDGELRSTERYEVPNEADCRRCHGGQGGMGLLGPRVPELWRDVAAEEGGSVDQLEAWHAHGLIEAPPDGLLEEVPAFPVWYEEGQPVQDLESMEGPELDRHARAYLDANCAGCHNPWGDTDNAGLDLRYHIDDPRKLGVCKRPSAAGSEATDGREYDVLPGDADQSVLVYRLESEYRDPGHSNRRMPPLARSLRHDEGVALLRAWVTWLGEPEAAEAYAGLTDQGCFDAD